jgi:hypothetical protein
MTEAQDDVIDDTWREEMNKTVTDKNHITEIERNQEQLLPKTRRTSQGTVTIETISKQEPVALLLQLCGEWNQHNIHLSGRRVRISIG